MSNLSFLSKVIEKTVSEHLKNHLKENNVYDAVQSAYHKFYSTESALLKVHNDVLMALDGDYTVALIMLDLSMAFDTIDHGVLFNWLVEQYGVKDQVLKGIQSYLSDRSWRVIVKDHRSQVRDLAYGVPQGSILGPLLFIMYVAPLSDLIHKHGHNNHSYADDTQLYCAFKQTNQHVSLTSLRKCVSDIRRWMKVYWLKLNDEKTEIMVFNSRLSQARQIDGGQDRAVIQRYQPVTM